jgi:hypothetical protein
MDIGTFTLKKYPWLRGVGANRHLPGSKSVLCEWDPSLIANG